MKLFKFSGAGNDFVILDGRKGDVSEFRQAERIGELCREYKTDGLMILGEAPDVDFSMEFYNPDGTGGMMCGNGGRCIVAFADMLGLVPASGGCVFLAPDGLHSAMILSGPERLSFSEPSLRDPSHLDRWAPPSYTAEGGHGFRERKPLQTWTVKLKMKDVSGITPMKGGFFLNTGTRHFVKFVEDVNAVDIGKEGPALRWDADFAPEGTNVNFVQAAPDGLHVRTFEKGVEGETLACGTGLTASALAAWQHSFGAKRPRGAGGLGPRSVEDSAALQASIRLQCRRGDWLRVDFTPEADGGFTDVFLTGPAELCR